MPRLSAETRTRILAAVEKFRAASEPQRRALLESSRTTQADLQVTVLPVRDNAADAPRLGPELETIGLSGVASNERQRTSFGPGTAGVAAHVHDRNRGAGLPSGLSDESFARLAGALSPPAPRQRRQASLAPAAVPADPGFEKRAFVTLADVEEAGFRRVAPGFYREANLTQTKTAHPIWELRGAEEGDGYVLIRRREERAVDLRLATSEPRPGGPGTEAAVHAGIIRQASARTAGAGRVYEDPSGLYWAEDMGANTLGVYFKSKRMKRPKYIATASSVDGAKKHIWRHQMEMKHGPAPRPQGPISFSDIPGHGDDFYRSREDGEKQGARRRAAGSTFQVSLLQTPGGSIADRKTIFSNEEMDLEALTRLVSEMKLGPTTLTHDSWSDGEWELRVRGPKGQLIHEYDSVGADEIGGAKGQVLLDTLRTILPSAPAIDMPPEAALLGEPSGDALPLGGDTGGAPPTASPAPAASPETAVAAGVRAPSAQALTRGARVMVVRQGQIADAVIMMVNPSQEAVQVMFSGGDKAEVPVDDIVGIGAGADMGSMDMVPVEGEDAMVEIGAGDIGDGDGDDDDWMMHGAGR